MYNYSLEPNLPIITASVIALCAGSAYVMYSKIKNSDIDLSFFNEVVNGLKDAPSDSCEQPDSCNINDNKSDNKSDSEINTPKNNHAAKTITSFFRDNLNKKENTQEIEDTLYGSVVVANN